MSTSKQIDKICIAIICLTLAVTILFVFGDSLNITSTLYAKKYESSLFDTSYVHQINLEVEDWDSFIETCENEEYTTCNVTVDGTKLEGVALRAKGNTSLSSVKSMNSQRYSFKLEFDHFIDGQTLDGLDKLCLNNLIQDNTMMKDYLVYQMMNEFGVDSPLSSFTYITVNGEDWGLYLAVEGIEDSFLSRNYGSEEGELYKPDTMNFGAGRGNGKGFNMDDMDFDEGSTKVPSDFNGEVPDFGGEAPDFSGKTSSESGDSSKDKEKGFSFGGMGSDDVKLKYIDDDPDSYSNIFDSAKTDVSKADQKRLIASLKNLSEYTNLEDSLDMEEVLRYFVVHNFVCNGDSYTGSMIHNYYLHEKDGKLSMIPWDYNLAFGTFMGGDASSSVNASIDNPISSGNLDDRPMLGWIFSDESYTEAYHELFSDFLEEWITDGKLKDVIRETEDMIRPYVEKDPTKFCTLEDFETGVDTLEGFVSLRGTAVERQLNGDNTPVGTQNLNLSTMGTMGGNRGRGGKQEGMTPPDGMEMPEGMTPPEGFNPFASEQEDTEEENATKGKSADSTKEKEAKRPDMSDRKGAGKSNGWLSIGVSVAVLAVGLLIAWKKKY